MMKRTAVIGLLVLCMSWAAFGQVPVGIVKKDLPQAEIDRIIKKFTTNEGLFRRALNIYAFKRFATIQTIGMGGQITGTYKRDSYLTFSEAGDRFEKILFFPMSSLKEISVSKEDIDNLGGIDPFAIEPRLVDQYKFDYLGKERIDELDLYVFDVGPKVMPDAKKGVAKFFQGRVWVDDEGLMIVKTQGKAVPEGKQRFPIIETIRENVDDRFYFPTYSSSDDTLVFPNGQVVKMKVRVRYSDYTIGKTDVIILDDDDPRAKPQPTPSPKP
ncbi:MAG: hypothetical protein KA956_02560 [Pyrinomonadaceae bacterium]|nr:hypothetical protein [Acidobacteriota bacterium]MBK7932225.1 hypothetical protein [Acidobacteriota bacterium]MBP7375340.1 hypothetical protein [Pyrinomonadaceae bacterium]